MKQYIIERFFPGAGKLTEKDLQGIAKTSCDILREMGPGIEWVNTYIMENRMYCVYEAENEDLLREHARRGGFPFNCVGEVMQTLDPSKALAESEEEEGQNQKV